MGSASPRIHLVGQIPDAYGSVITGGDEYVFGGVGSQAPDLPLHVAVDHDVGGSVLLSHLDHLSILRPHQDLTLKTREGDFSNYLVLVFFFVFADNTLKTRVYECFWGHVLDDSLTACECVCVC